LHFKINGCKIGRNFEGLEINWPYQKLQDIWPLPLSFGGILIDFKQYLLANIQKKIRTNFEDINLEEETSRL